MVSSRHSKVELGTVLSRDHIGRLGVEKKKRTTEKVAATGGDKKEEGRGQHQDLIWRSLEARREPSAPSMSRFHDLMRKEWQLSRLIPLRRKKSNVGRRNVSDDTNRPPLVFISDMVMANNSMHFISKTATYTWLQLFKKCTRQHILFKSLNWIKREKILYQTAGSRLVVIPSIKILVAIITPKWCHAGSTGWHWCHRIMSKATASKVLDEWQITLWN